MNAFYLENGTLIAEGNIVGLINLNDKETLYRITEVRRVGILELNRNFVVELVNLYAIENPIEMTNSELDDARANKAAVFYNVA